LEKQKPEKKKPEAVKSEMQVSESKESLVAKDHSEKPASTQNAEI